MPLSSLYCVSIIKQPKQTQTHRHGNFELIRVGGESAVCRSVWRCVILMDWVVGDTAVNSRSPLIIAHLPPAAKNHIVGHSRTSFFLSRIPLRKPHLIARISSFILLLPCSYLYNGLISWRCATRASSFSLTVKCPVSTTLRKHHSWNQGYHRYTWNEVQVETKREDEKRGRPVRSRLHTLISIA